MAKRSIVDYLLNLTQLTNHLSLSIRPEMK
jgi:hypothetical protein